MFDYEIPKWSVWVVFAIFGFIFWKAITTDNAPDPATVQDNRIRHECRLKIVGARPPGWFSSGEDAWVCPDGVTWYISTIKK